MISDSEQKVALVTGANRGIGYEIARKLADKNLSIRTLLGIRDRAKGDLTMERLKAQGLEAEAVEIDVSDPVMIQAAIGKIKDQYNRLDILVNNAGIMIDPETSILELNKNILLNTLETNVFGPLFLCQACIPLMKKRGYGRIVNLASTLGSLNEMASPDSDTDIILSSAYRLSKTLLNGITLLLAGELRGTDILVNSACPGWVRTDLGGSRAPLTPEQGADTPFWLATLPKGGPSGGFFRERHPIPW